MNKHAALAIVIAAALMGIGGCTPAPVMPAGSPNSEPPAAVLKAGTPIVEALGPAAAEFDQLAATSNAAMNLTYFRGREAGRTFTVESPSFVREVYDLAANLTLGDTCTEMVTDFDDTLTFELATGEKLTMAFEAHRLVLAGTRYEVRNADPLWDLVDSIPAPEME